MGRHPHIAVSHSLRAGAASQPTINPWVQGSCSCRRGSLAADWLPGPPAAFSSSGRWPRRPAGNRWARSAPRSPGSPGPASDQGEPFREPTWTGFRRPSATSSHCLGCSSARWALLGDVQRHPESDWGSRGRRFKSGRPDCFSNASGTDWEPNGN